MEYGLRRPTFILRSIVASYGLIILKYDVHTSVGLQEIRQNHWTIKYGSWRHTFILRSNVGSHRLITSKSDVHTSNGLQDIKRNHWTMKYGSRRPTFILGSNDGSHGLIFKVRYSYIKWSSRYKAKSLDHEIWDTTTYIYFRSNVGSYGLIIPKYDVHTSNGLQDMRQNHWTMKYGSRRPTFILGQTWDHTDS